MAQDVIALSQNAELKVWDALAALAGIVIAHETVKGLASHTISNARTYDSCNATQDCVHQYSK